MCRESWIDTEQKNYAFIWSLQMVGTFVHSVHECLWRTNSASLLFWWCTIQFSSGTTMMIHTLSHAKTIFPFLSISSFLARLYRKFSKATSSHSNHSPSELQSQAPSSLQDLPRWIFIKPTITTPGERQQQPRRVLNPKLCAFLKTLWRNEMRAPHLSSWTGWATLTSP